uniref:Uncharacterized protein n=1 Tax=Anopheles dirus TaxID=7168 RepID=A0A182MYI2_9DIPT
MDASANTASYTNCFRHGSGRWVTVEWRNLAESDRMLSQPSTSASKRELSVRLLA